MTNIEESSASGPYEKDGRAWSVGTQDDVSWIQQGLTPGTGITTAIPPEFEAYATIALCKGEPGDRVPTDPSGGRVYAALLGHIAGTRLLSAEQVAAAAAVAYTGRDQVMEMKVSWSLGYSPTAPATPARVRARPSGWSA
jgi:hypothetical protein